MVRPSFIASAISGTIIIIATLIAIVNLSSISKDSFKLVSILLLLGIAYGIHGISHYYEEIYFNFNPLVGKLTPDDDPNKNV